MIGVLIFVLSCCNWYLIKFCFILKFCFYSQQEGRLGNITSDFEFSTFNLCAASFMHVFKLLWVLLPFWLLASCIHPVIYSFRHLFGRLGNLSIVRYGSCLCHDTLQILRMSWSRLLWSTNYNFWSREEWQ